MGFLDRLLGKKPKPVQPAVLDVSEANLRTVLGNDNVTIASGIAIAPVSPDGARRDDVSGRDQVGGVPANIGAEMWPRCTMCRCPMTFIAQLAVGPDEEPLYPERGSVAIFLCNSEPPTADALCQTYEGTGSACFFVGEALGAATPMFSEAELGEIAHMLQRNADPDESAVNGYLMAPDHGWQARPVLHRAYRAERRRVVSCRVPEAVASTSESEGGRAREAAYALWAAATQAAGVAVEIGGFPDWIQAPIEDLVCSCGAAMELIVQYEAFDNAINLGDAGRAYVFACAKRCSPTAFVARWDCC